MIRVTKPTRPPAVLRTQGAALAAQLCLDYDAGITAFNFDAKVYGHPSVKKALRKCQHDKCCFCESKISHIQYGDVEHFRPKAGFRQLATDPLTAPGYYWLAYDWSNLFLCCQLCNQRYKQNLFPLTTPGSRALSHHDVVAKEDALFVDPERVDPALHIGFRRHVAYAVNGSALGQATIDALQLNRVHLRRQRLQLYESLMRLNQARANLRQALGKLQPTTTSLREQWTQSLSRIQRKLAKQVHASAEYSAMARAALA